MATRRQRRRPASTPEARENQLVSSAIDLIERRILDGTASAQETLYFARLGSSRETLEQERLRHENEKLKAQIENMASAKRVEELYDAAIAAMRNYSGHTVEEDSPYDEEYYYDED